MGIHEIARFERGGRWLAFAGLVLLIVVRAPRLLVEPRFWAEEATVFYSHALQSSALDGLLQIPRGTAGYFLLSATAPTTFAAHALPLAAGPWVTTYTALAVMLVPLAIILFGRSLVWTTPARRLLACAIVLFAPSAVGEVWLNSTNSQVYCGLTSLCILCEDLTDAPRSRLVLYAGLVAVGGLSGVYTAFLLPAFVYRWLWERSRAMGVLVIAAGVTALVQLAVFVDLAAENAIAASKFQDIRPARSLALLIYSQLVLPVGGEAIGHWIGDRLELVPLTGRYGPAALAVLVISTLAAGGLLAILLERRLRSVRNLLALAFACLAILTTISATWGVAWGRYAVLPGYTILFLLLACLRQDSSDRLRPVRLLLAALLLVMSLSVGVSGYRRDAAFRCYGPCPSWPTELARWRRDPAYWPQVWPTVVPPTGPQWRVALSPSQGAGETSGR